MSTIRRIPILYWQCAGCRIMVNSRFSYCPRCGWWRYSTNSKGQQNGN